MSATYDEYRTSEHDHDHASDDAHATGAETHGEQTAGGETTKEFGGPVVFIDSLLRSDARWGDESGFGNPGGNVTFSFATDEGAMTATSTARALVVESLRMIADVADITFSFAGPGPIETQNGTNGDIDYRQFGTGPNGSGVGGWQAVRSFGDPTFTITDGYVSVTGENLSLFLHESMHALGLSHPGDYDGAGATYANDALAWDDSVQFTVMSYFDASNTGGQFGSFAGTGLMLYDIAALQTAYGVNTTTRTGDTVYGFNSTALIEGSLGATGTIDDRWRLDDAGDDIIASIWDAGGTDTIDLSGYATDSVIDLRESGFSSFGGLTNNMSIAIGAVVENAIGGSGDDTFVLNGAANVIAGGAGTDTLDLTSANASVRVNLITGGTGGVANGDSFVSIENVEGSRFGDVIAGTNAGNVIRSGGGVDVIFGFDGDDVLDGGSGNDRLDGGAGADALIGGLGSDVATYAAASSGISIDLRLSGGGTLGDSEGDTFSSIDGAIGSAFADTIIGFAGVNVLFGGDGNDIIDGFSGNDILRGDAGDDFIIGGAGNDRLSGGTGADTFVFIQGAGRDRIDDFQDGTDLLDFYDHTGVTGIDDLTIRSFGSSAVIEDNAGSVLVLAGMAGNVDASDFIFQEGFVTIG